MPNSKPRVAIVEDDDDLRDSMIEYLSAEGYPVWGVSSGEALYRQLLVDSVNVLVLDVGLPGEDGFTIAKHVSQIGNVAIVIVSARDSVDDRLTGLNSGADLYLIKPVDLRELAANIEAVWRRVGGGQSVPAVGGDNGSESGRWQLDQKNWRLLAPNGKEVGLTSKEYGFIRCLADATGATVSKTTVAVALGGDQSEYVFHRIDVTLARLRKKVQGEVELTLPVKTVQGLGYMLTVPVNLI